MTPSISRAPGARPLDVLLLLTDFPTWAAARHWSYAAQMGFEEGFAANNVRCTTIAAPYLRWAPAICRGRRFDQAWVEVVHNAGPTPGWYDWVAGVAPVRVGVVAESLTYGPDDCRVNPAWATRKAEVWKRLPYLTHVLAVDEADAAEIEAAGAGRAMWCPQAVPRRVVARALPPPNPARACFSGARYGERARWLSEGPARTLLTYQESPEARTPIPALYTGCTLAALAAARLPRLPCRRLQNDAYLAAARRIRRNGFARWMTSLRSAGIVVNLPHIVKAYPSRVVEAMAAGRPVVAWDVPGRPRNRALFTEGEEILFYDKERPQTLVDAIRKLQADVGLAARLARAARLKVLGRHTLEKRIGQVLGWVESGREAPEP